ncbi:MAG: hypothetical protein P4L22_03385 [Candidatus Babeliales bacterium]|nr:hypothetical protein [Candidatus Babeliales bacterium]
MKNVLLGLIVILNMIQVYAKDGDLDLTFNESGKFNIQLGKQFSILYSVAIEKNQKIVAVGTSDINFAIIRLNVDGSLDNSFGTKGKVILPITNISSLSMAIAIEKDGKIVITGVSDDQFVVVRVKPNGQLDGTFGTNGVVKFTFGYGIDSNAVALQKNGKIIIGGDSYAGRALNITRLKIDGNFDPVFTDTIADGVGKVLIQFDLNAMGKSVAIQNDGKILICGNIGGFFSVLRLQNNGALDLDFGPFGLGYVPIVSGVSSCANSVTIQPDQKIVLGGQSDDKFVLARLNTDGSLDKTFNQTGFIETQIDKKSIIQSVALQSWDGKIVVAGYSVLNLNKFIVARYTIDGTLDSTFGNNGIVVTNFAVEPFLGNAANSIAIDSKARKIVAAGYAGKQIAVARYIGDSNFCLDKDVFIKELNQKYS